MKSTRPVKQSRNTGYLKKLRKNISRNYVLAAAFVVVFGIGGSLFLFLSHAQATYYKGNCTLTTVGNGASGACVQQAQDLLDALEHAQIAAGHDYRTAAGPGEGVFQYGSAYYLVMDGSYGNATANAVSRLYGNNSLTGGTSSDAGWQILCSSLAQYGLDTNTGAGASTLKFSNTSGQYTNSPTYVIFNYTCGSQVPVPSSSSSSTSSNSSNSDTGNNNTSSSTTANDTASSGEKCTDYTFSHSGNNAPSKALSGDCIYYIQTILNGAWTSNPYSYLTPANNYDTYFNVNGGTIGGVSKTDNNYNEETEVRVMAFQATMAYNGTPLSVTGTTDASTWGALCALAKSYGAVPNTTDIQLARQVVTNSANSDSGCSTGSIGKTSPDPHQTTPPPLNCPNGINSAKTVCNCPSGQTYVAGACQVTGGNGSGLGGAAGAGAGAAAGAIVGNGGGNIVGSEAAKVNYFNVSRAPSVGAAVYLLSWSTQNTSFCSFMPSGNINDVTFSSSGSGFVKSSGSATMSVTLPHQAFTLTLWCDNKYYPSVGSFNAYATQPINP